VIILDTDHINILQNEGSGQYLTLTAKMAASSDQQFVTTVVTLEEQMRGWLALIHRSADIHRQVASYAKLNDLVDYFGRWTRLDFDDDCATRFEDLRRQKVRIGTMDLKIAATCLVHNSLLLSANVRDFEQVPDLRVEDWLHE
jgi:tRNA(fMet)-specific endonuclease VapC